jgi:hypothetical protein
MPSALFPRLAVILGFVAASLSPTLALGTEPTSLYDLPFSAGTVDPASDLSETDPEARDLVLVQLEDFGATEMVHAVASTGADLVQPLAPVSYLVWANASETRAIRALDGIRFAGVLPPSLRVAPSVTASTSTLRVTIVGTLPDVLRASMRTWPRAFTQLEGTVVEVPGGAAEAAALARLPRVYSVADAGGTPQLRDELGAAIVSQGTGSALTPTYRSFLTSHGADGTGVIVSHVDSGADLNHPDLDGRVQACVDYGPVDRCDAGNHDDVIGHGTHTLGIVLGTGATGLGDIDGFDYGLGVAPGAKAVVQNAIGLGSAYFPDGYTALYKEAQDLGAIVSQNSWGPAGDPQGYDEDTREFDAMVRDVDSAEAGDQPLGLVFSIMNGGGGTSTQGSPDEGKNIIGVGGTFNRGPLQGKTPDDLCTCSAHGPALDGRLLPTLVAPGQQVISTRAAQGTLCGAPFVGYSPTAPSLEVPPSPLHAGCTGTSMASPHVSGGYAVFVDWYRDHFGGATPSPALVKAALVNGADDLAGGKDADGNVMSHIPNNQQGWGRMHLGNVLSGWTAGAVHVDQSVVFTASGQSHEVTVSPVDPSKPLKATLVWTDALGHGQGGELPAWVNDLDLTVTAADGTGWLGNVFAEGLSVTGGEPDRKNNIENVYLGAPSAGSYRVTVSAANIIGDGIPSLAGPTDQDFALVITNARVVPA